MHELYSEELLAGDNVHNSSYIRLAGLVACISHLENTADTVGGREVRKEPILRRGVRRGITHRSGHRTGRKGRTTLDEVDKREKSAKERSGKRAKADTEQAVQDAIDEAMIPPKWKEKEKRGRSTQPLRLLPTTGSSLDKGR